MEIWDLYDFHEKFLNKTHQRGKKLSEGEYHYVVQVWVFTLDGKVLLTQRHPNKTYGLEWEVTGGSVLAGETCLQGIQRELFEETGIQAHEEEFKYMGCFTEGNSHYKKYILVKDVKLSDIVLQENETVDACFVDVSGLKKMVEEDKLAKPILENFIRYWEILKTYMK